MEEARWDLGVEGVVRLVSDENGVETVYVGTRIAARTRAGAPLDEHRVALSPRAGVRVGDVNAASLEANAPARELLLRRTPRGWIAVRDGHGIPPAERSEPAAPSVRAGRAPRPSRWKTVVAWVIVGSSLLAAAGRTFRFPGFLHVAQERQALLSTPHETELAVDLANENGTLTLRAPSDFRVEQTSASSLRVMRKELGEALEVVVIADPKTVDLDVIVRGAADAMRGKAAQGPGTQDIAIELGETASGTCNGEPGRALTGRLVTEAGRTFVVWLCASVRPGVGIGEHLPPIQVFDSLVPEPLAARDEPLLRSMLASTTIRDEAFSGAVAPSVRPPPERAEPLQFPPGAMAGPGHVTSHTSSSPSYAPQIVDLRPQR